MKYAIQPILEEIEVFCAAQGWLLKDDFRIADRDELVSRLQQRDETFEVAAEMAALLITLTKTNTDIYGE